MPLSQAPTYNLKAVLRETGVGADTLRAWERRYGLPQPQRTPGGHRLYSQRDINLIKWLVSQQADGLSISRAVQHWNELAAAGEDPLADVLTATDLHSAGPLARLDSVREDWLASCFAFDVPGAEHLLSEAFALYTPETVITDVILRGLREIGSRWQAGRATVQQEHFMSGLAMQRLNMLVAAAPLPVHPGTVVLACPPTELHSLPLLYLHVMLRRRGRSVVFLGADVPMEHLDETTQTVNAALVVMGAQRLAAARALQDAAAVLGRNRVPVAYGGHVFNELPELRRQITGTFLGEGIDESLDQIEALLETSVTVQKPVEAGMNLLAQAYWASRPAIEAALHRSIGGQAETAADLAIANSYFGGALAAALEFGNVDYLAVDMEWIRFLVTRPRLPFDSPRTYVMAYATATRDVMDSRGHEIAGKLEQYAEQA